MSRDGKGLVEPKDWVLEGVLNVIFLLWHNNIPTKYSAKDILLSAIFATVNSSSISNSYVWIKAFIKLES